MPRQILTLKLDGITAGDYLTWCRDPDPPALGFALRSVHADGDPLGDTITATLDWNHAPPPPPAAAAELGECEDKLVPDLRPFRASWDRSLLGRGPVERGGGPRRQSVNPGGWQER